MRASSREVQEFGQHESSPFAAWFTKLLAQPRLAVVANSDVEIAPKLFSNCEGVGVIDLRLSHIGSLPTCQKQFPADQRIFRNNDVRWKTPNLQQSVYSIC